jgi:inorganic pyrophosphatase
MSEVDVIIEISKGSHIKYEYDKERNMIVCDRILHTPMKYPFNYGFIPNTLSEDGDPLDVVVLMDDELVPGCVIKCKILGYLDTKDDEGNDPKIIACPIGKIDPMWRDIDDLFTLEVTQRINKLSNQNGNAFIEWVNNRKLNNFSNQNVNEFIDWVNNRELNNSTTINHTLMRVIYFFQHYKDLENKSVTVGEFYNKSQAIQIYTESKNRFKYNITQKNKITDYFKRN